MEVNLIPRSPSWKRVGLLGHRDHAGQAGGGGGEREQGGAEESAEQAPSVGI